MNKRQNIKDTNQNEYAVVNLERYERLIDDQHKFETLMGLFEKSVKFVDPRDPRNDELTIVDDKDILAYLKTIKPDIGWELRFTSHEK